MTRASEEITVINTRADEMIDVALANYKRCNKNSKQRFSLTDADIAPNRERFGDKFFSRVIEGFRLRGIEAARTPVGFLFEVDINQLIMKPDQASTYAKAVYDQRKKDVKPVAI